MANPPLKFHEGNKLIHDPNGIIHFVNEKKKEYYWTAKPFQVAYTNEKDTNLKDYFDFFKESDELLYFDESGHHKRINCNNLQQELDFINEGREDGVKFKFSARDSTFWLDFLEGTLFLHEKEVENLHLDMFRIVRRDYHIWDAGKSKKLDLSFSRFIECRGPCICKPGDAPHDENDYMQQNIQEHEDLRDTNMFVLRFREYDSLLRYERTFKPLPKPILIVHYNQPVACHDATYHALYQQGHLPAIAKEITGANQAQKNRLCEQLDKFNSDKQFLTFYGIHEFQNRSFLVFQSFSDCPINSSESLFGTSLSQEEGKERLLKNLKGLIEGVSYLHNDVKVYGSVDSSNVVVVKNRGTGQNELKLFGAGFVVARRKTKWDDLRGLADVFECLIDMFDCENEESKHLIQCLRDGSCNISDLKEHPMFWIPETKLEFICACYLAWKNITCFEQLLPSIEPAVAKGKRGNIDTLFFLRMEKYGSYAVGKPSCIGQLTRFIRHAKTHEKELSKEDVGWFYNYNLKGMEQYFRERFPNLLIELYQLVQQTCARDEIFKLFDIPSV